MKYVIKVEAITTNVLIQELTVEASSKAEAMMIIGMSDGSDEHIIDVEFVSDTIIATDKENILSIKECEIV